MKAARTPGSDDEDRRARVAWTRIAEPGDPVAAALIAEVGAAAALRVVQTRCDSVLERFRPRLARLDVGRDLETAARCGARIVVPGDDEWPAGLDDLAAPPACLWVRGPLHLARLSQCSVAIVGARAATAYGERLAADIAAGVAEAGYTVVSGAAFGIDAAAHRGALAVSGSTVAVLAGGVDRPYPIAHTDLLTQIAETGAVVAEVAPGSAPTRPRFLLRNRLIATMTGGTLVVEAGLRSGSRNTAGSAADHGRVVMALPGPVTSMMSAGCHELIRSGAAVLVTDAEEVIDAVGRPGTDMVPPRRGPERTEDRLSGVDRVVFEALPLRKEVSVAQLAWAAGLPEREVAAALGRLGLLGGAVRGTAGWRRGTIRGHKD